MKSHAFPKSNNIHMYVGMCVCVCVCVCVVMYVYEGLTN